MTRARAADRQLRLVHVQPRARAWASGRRRRRRPQRRDRRRRACRAREPDALVHLARARAGRPRRASRVDADRALRTAGCRSSASASGTSCSAEMYGGTVTHAQRLVHGKAAHGRSTAADEPSSRGSATSSRPAATTRWSRSAAARRARARPRATADGEVMAMRHRDAPTHGVQFHPESILTPPGRRLLGNFLRATSCELSGDEGSCRRAARRRARTSASTESRTRRWA